MDPVLEALASVSLRLATLQPAILDKPYHVRRQYERCLNELRELQILAELN